MVIIKCMENDHVLRVCVRMRMRACAAWLRAQVRVDVVILLSVLRYEL